jgi:hypothetical protein
MRETRFGPGQGEARTAGSSWGPGLVSGVAAGDDGTVDTRHRSISNRLRTWVSSNGVRPVVRGRLAATNIRHWPHEGMTTTGCKDGCLSIFFSVSMLYVLERLRLHFHVTEFTENKRSPCLVQIS